VAAGDTVDVCVTVAAPEAVSVCDGVGA
jgi:hypothetical protein